MFHVKESINEVGTTWKKKEDEGRYMEGRDGDMWMAPFQCDHCWFINLEGRYPELRSRVDQNLLGYIRRVNLDVLWSREAGTVGGVLTQLRKMCRLSDDLGMTRSNVEQGPWPLGDNMGFRTAIVILRASQEKGRNDPTYQQFDSIRKIRTCQSNCYENSAIGNQHVLAFRAEKGTSYKLSHCETESRLFVKFMKGLELRMGRLVKSNMGLDHRILSLIVSNYDKELADGSVPWKRKHKVIMTGGYLMLCFGASLRGNEGFYLEQKELLEMIHYGNSSRERRENVGHVCAPLKGRFKAETGKDTHVAVIVNVSKSGFKFRLWLERVAMLVQKEKRHLDQGPAFCRPDGTMIRSYEMDWEFHKALKIVQLQRPDLLPEDVDVGNIYGTYRSMRRGANTKATEEGVEEPVLDLINRWRKFESKRGGQPVMSMRQHYLEISLVLKRFLAYSEVL